MCVCVCKPLLGTGEPERGELAPEERDGERADADVGVLDCADKGDVSGGRAAAAGLSLSLSARMGGNEAEALTPSPSALLNALPLVCPPLARLLSPPPLTLTLLALVLPLFG